MPREVFNEEYPLDKRPTLPSPHRESPFTLPLLLCLLFLKIPAHTICLSPPGRKTIISLHLQGNGRGETHSAGDGERRRGWGKELPRGGGRQRRRLFTGAFTSPTPQTEGPTALPGRSALPARALGVTEELGSLRAPSLRPKPRSPSPRPRAASAPPHPGRPSRRHAEA